MYATARQWVQEHEIHSMWDLFCGVGGFGLHCAGPETQLTGIEISAEAIACARQSAEQLGLKMSVSPRWILPALLPLKPKYLNWSW